MLAYVRRRRDADPRPLPVQGAAADALIFDIGVQNDDETWQELCEAIKRCPVSAVVVLADDGDRIPAGLDEVAQCISKWGGRWSPDPVSEVLAVLLTDGHALTASRLREIYRQSPATSWAEGEFLRTTDAVKLTRAAVETQTTQMRNLAMEVIAHFHQRERDVNVQEARAATATSAAFATAHLAGVTRFESREEMLKWALPQAPQGGLCLEFGVYSGHTINLLAEMRESTVYGFDSFEGLPESWRTGFPAGTFATTLPEVRPNVELVRGWFHESLPPFLAAHSEPLAFLHVDCDLYSSTATVLSALADRIVPGTIVCFDEYFNYPGWEMHEHRAWLEHAAERGVEFQYVGYSDEQVAVRVNATK